MSQAGRQSPEEVKSVSKSLEISPSKSQGSSPIYGNRKTASGDKSAASQNRSGFKKDGK